MAGYQSIQEQVFRAQLARVLSFPLVVALVAVVISIILIAAAPYLVKSLVVLSVEMPLTTKIVVSWSVFLSDNWYWIILGALGTTLFIYTFLKTKEGARVLDNLSFKVGPTALLVKKINIVHVLRSLASLTAANILLPKALEIASENIRNSYYKGALLDMAGRMRAGYSFSSVLALHHNLFPLTISQAVIIGEETGKSAIILEKLGDLFEEEVWREVVGLENKVLPGLILLVGAFIGFLVVALIQPLILLVF
jgi:type II secretory pathway component PulF